MYIDNVLFKKKIFFEIFTFLYFLNTAFTCFQNSGGSRFHVVPFTETCTFPCFVQLSY
jgi:hypothetical protein